MSFESFKKSLKGDTSQLEEDIKLWKSMNPEQKAAAIKEVKDSGSEEDRAYLLEVSKLAESEETPGTEAGGASDQSGKEIDPTSKGGEPKMATDLSDDDPAQSDKTKLAAAAGIGAGLGAMNMAKKLRREQIKKDVVATGQ